MKEGKNIFKLDGPISRKTFITTMGIILGYTVFASILFALLQAVFEPNKFTIILFVGLVAAFFISLLYTSWLNYTKRIWDILGDKGNAIFYSIAIFIANVAFGFIPALKIVGLIFSISVLLVLLLKKGKFVKVKKAKVKEDVE